MDTLATNAFIVFIELSPLPIFLWFL